MKLKNLCLAAVVCLLPLSAHAEQKRRVCRRIELRAIQRRAFAFGGEVGNVVRAIRRPAFADHPLDNVLCVADERIEAEVARLIERLRTRLGARLRT